MIEIMEKVRDHIWFVMTNQKYKEAHTVVSLMIKETIILLPNTCQTVLLYCRDKLKIIQEKISGGDIK